MGVRPKGVGLLGRGEVANKLNLIFLFPEWIKVYQFSEFRVNPALTDRHDNIPLDFYLGSVFIDA